MTARALAAKSGAYQIGALLRYVASSLASWLFAAPAMPRPYAARDVLGDHFTDGTGREHVDVGNRTPSRATRVHAALGGAARRAPLVDLAEAHARSRLNQQAHEDGPTSPTPLYQDARPATYRDP